MEAFSRDPQVLTVVLSEPDDFLLENFSNFFYDSLLLHDCVVLAIGEYHYNFGPQFYYRTGRPVRHEDKLRLRRLRHESPLLVETIVMWGAASLAIRSTYEWLRDRPLHRRKLEAETGEAEERREIARIDRQLKELDLNAQRAESEVRPTSDGRTRYQITPDDPPLALRAGSAEIADDPQARKTFPCLSLDGCALGRSTLRLLSLARQIVAIYVVAAVSSVTRLLDHSQRPFTKACFRSGSRLAGRASSPASGRSVGLAKSGAPRAAASGRAL